MIRLGPVTYLDAAKVGYGIGLLAVAMLSAGCAMRDGSAPHPGDPAHPGGVAFMGVGVGSRLS